MTIRAIAYTIPLILSDGTVYGVLGIEMTTAYLQSLLPFWELQNEQAGSTCLLPTPEICRIRKSPFLLPAVQPAPEWKPITQRIHFC